MTRGIQNVSGVSCHISCALQLLAHSVPKLTEDQLSSQLDDPEETSSIPTVLRQLLHVLTTLKVVSPEALDPSLLYRWLQETSSLNPEDVGDVSTALYQLWQVIGKIDKDWKAVVDYLVLNGETQQVICGKRQEDEHVLVRIKRGKVKRMACPFPVLLGQTSSIQDALQQSAQAQNGTPVEGYDWDSQSKDAYIEKSLPLENDGDGDGDLSRDWTTNKSMQILKFPRHLFLTIERFAYQADGQRVWKYPKLDIPMQMKVGESNFHLCGGVLHVNEDLIDEEGHYVTLVSTVGQEDQFSSSSDCSWTVIDDDTCRAVDQDTAQSWLCGGSDENDGRFYCAILLAYRSNDTMVDEQEWDQVVARIKERGQHYDPSSIDWSKPKSIIGKRLKIQWAKGKSYEGVVDHYDESTGKHRVQYNDGDVREYTLSKKIIEWL